MELTKETDKFLCLIYKEYLTRRKADIPKSDAIRFSSPDQLVYEFMQGVLPDDIRSSIASLKSIGFVKTNILGNFFLEDKAIIYMETRFTNGLKSVIDFISKFKPY